MGKASFICIPSDASRVAARAWEGSARLIPVIRFISGCACYLGLLHPRYMHVLVPNPEIEKASTLATPLLIDMLDAAAK